MNKSGDAVRQALSFFKLTAQDMTVIYDEIDLAPSKIRVKRGGAQAAITVCALLNLGER